MRSVDFLCLVPALCNHLLIMLVVSVISAAQQTLCMSAEAALIVV